MPKQTKAQALALRDKAIGLLRSKWERVSGIDGTTYYQGTYRHPVDGRRVYIFKTFNGRGQVKKAELHIGQALGSKMNLVQVRNLIEQILNPR